MNNTRRSTSHHNKLAPTTMVIGFNHILYETTHGLVKRFERPQSFQCTRTNNGLILDQLLRSLLPDVSPTSLCT